MNKPPRAAWCLQPLMAGTLWLAGAVHAGEAAPQDPPSPSAEPAYVVAQDDGRPPEAQWQPPPLPSPLAGRVRDHRQRRSRPVDDLSAHARAMLPYAALATTVYCDDVFKREDPADNLDDPRCKDNDGPIYLAQQGWSRVLSVPGTALDSLRGSLRGLRLAVYYRMEGTQAQVVVAFRGTDFSSWSDWHTNLRWFLPGRDQYDVVAEMGEEIVRRARSEIERREQARAVTDWKIVTTGHSLGGGLAQLLAYKNRAVSAAVVFDPSPVTGYFSCVRDEEVNCSVPVWRVYERGEVLAYVRGVVRLFYMLSENITEVELNLVERGNPILNHSMPRFFRGLQAIVARQPSELTAVDLFHTQPDCACWRERRGQEYPNVAQACERLAEQRASGQAVAEVGGAAPLGGLAMRAAPVRAH